MKLSACLLVLQARGAAGHAGTVLSHVAKTATAAGSRPKYFLRYRNKRAARWRMTEVQVKVKDPKNEICQVTLGRRKCSRKFLDKHSLLSCCCVNLLLSSLNPYNMLTVNVKTFVLSKTQLYHWALYYEICAFSGNPLIISPNWCQ